MDVVYCKAGVWHIVDYKTNADGNALDVKYQNQLEAYKKGIRKDYRRKSKGCGYLSHYMSGMFDGMFH